jgi:hypothetical protein
MYKAKAVARFILEKQVEEENQERWRQHERLVSPF